MLRRSKLFIIAIIVSMTMNVAAQELTFTSSEGEAVTLASLRGKVVVLLFGGAQDPQCREEFKALQSLVERYQGKAVSVFWVSVNTRAEMSDDKLKSPCGPTFSVSVVRDQGQTAFRKFGGRQLPTIVVLDQQGQPHGQPRGGFNPNSDFVNDLAAIIDSLLNRK
ncbi:MAG: TlpA disulfide reductase family protein [Acidobacteriota bacterium]